MKTRDLESELARIAGYMKKEAALGAYDGRVTPLGRVYLDRCTRVHPATATALIFTRDIGHHTSGWLKNPDHERCLHLSISRAPSALILPRGQIADLDKKLTAKWVRAFFGDDIRNVWAESPKTPEGKRRGVWHWRVFCDRAWNPITPRGEVYSTEFTEAGWRSASQVLEEDGLIVSSDVDPG